jgi:hypothetical protein
MKVKTKCRGDERMRKEPGQLRLPPPLLPQGVSTRLLLWKFQVIGSSAAVLSGQIIL